jgi:hypothetical protein
MTDEYIKDFADNQQLNIASVIVSTSFKKLIEEAIKSAKDTNWCWNGEDEYPVTTFDIDIATNKVIEVLQQHLL